MPPTLDDAVEELVDAVRSVATRVREHLEIARALRDAFEEINEQSEEWEQYKEAKCLLQQAEQLLPEAKDALGGTSTHRSKLTKKVGGGALDAFAMRVVDRACADATTNMNSLTAVVEDVRENYMTFMHELMVRQQRDH